MHVDHASFIQSPIDGHLGHFRLSAIVNNAAVDLGVHADGCCSCLFTYFYFAFCTCCSIMLRCNRLFSILLGSITRHLFGGAFDAT